MPLIELKDILTAITKRQTVINRDDLRAVTLVLSGVVGLNKSTDSEAWDKLTFLSNAKYVDMLTACKAGVILVSPEFSDKVPDGVIGVVVKDPYLAYACASQLFECIEPSFSIHKTAVVDDTAVVGGSVSIGAYSVIGAGAIIGDRTVIGNQVSIGDGVEIGKDCIINHQVTINHDCIIGNECIIHNGAVIGADGFGFAPSGNPSVDGWERIAQLGKVIIGERVRIGANTCIDRGAVDDTIIGNDVIIDNLVQIAHNVQIGDGTAMAAMTGIAGSTTIGKGCVIGGNVGVAGHLRIGDFVTLTGRTFVTGSIANAGSYSSGTVAMPTNEWRRAAVKFRQMGKK